MSKNEKLLKYLLLVFAGIAVGALVFSNVELNLSVNGPNLTSRPNFATAKSNIENYPIQSLKSFNDAFVQIAESATPSVVTIFTEKKVSQRGMNPMDFFGRPFDDFFGHSFDDFFDKSESGLRNGRSEVQRGLGQGIVSAKGRANVGLADYEDFIQTDAAINPGNSGGALVNINGELVGINTAIASRTGGFEGIGFAVPSNMARKVLTSLITTGKVTRGYLGVSIQDIDDNLAKAMHLKVDEGVLVGTVVEGSPAAKAGVKTGDVILDFNGTKVTSSITLRNSIASQSPGTIVKFRVLRDGVIRLFSVRLEEQTGKEMVSRSKGEEKVITALGFKAEELTAEVAQKLNRKPGAGKVVITTITPSSNAYHAGLRRGDIILSVNRQSVTSFAHYSSLVSSIKSGDLLFLLVDRGGSKIYFAFNV